jgi:hypothetical protein
MSPDSAAGFPVLSCLDPSLVLPFSRYGRDPAASCPVMTPGNLSFMPHDTPHHAP